MKSGQTGRVEGERPYCEVKIALAILAALLLTLAAAYGYQRA